MRRPHVCPVCHGQRTVPRGFYAGRPNGHYVDWPATTTGEREPCQTCEGSGVVWDRLVVEGPPEVES